MGTNLFYSAKWQNVSVNAKLVIESFHNSLETRSNLTCFRRLAVFSSASHQSSDITRLYSFLHTHTHTAHSPQLDDSPCTLQKKSFSHLVFQSFSSKNIETSLRQDKFTREANQDFQRINPELRVFVLPHWSYFKHKSNKIYA